MKMNKKFSSALHRPPLALHSA